MRVLFMGTPDFAVASLKALVESGHEVCGVFTQPDKQKNRGHKVVFSPVKEYAVEHNLAVYQPLKMRDGQAYEIVKELAPELIVVAAYGKILPEDILNEPKYGSINVHSSILPKYRGAAPINWAILNGENKTGVTIMYMAKELDAGDIIKCVETDISNEEDAYELTGRLAVLGAEALLDVVASFENNTVSRVPQKHEEFTYAPMLDKSMSPIDWNRSAWEIHNQVRGLIPWPCASAQLGGNNLKIYKTSVGGRTEAKPGTVVQADKKGLAVACGDGKKLEILELQAEGGKRMASTAFLMGHPIPLG